ncbi:MAG TPA: hypothetical protein VGN74_04600 [Brevundimonas sp.]|jgi:hypothetical protein|uniref:hypothetical protein n=1 Tax=Brevundimonas sp. TaxID=1871086 RepID=UPI002E11A667|nr:hypothetical protein [Brevundimonas sp.]
MQKTALALAALMIAAPAVAQQAPAAPAGNGHAGHGAPAAATPAAPAFTIDTPIRDILANPAAAAVLEKHIPGIAAHPARPQFEAMSLKQVQPLSQGAITDAMLTAIDTELKAL